MMRIVALNIRAGGGQRVAALLRYLDQHDPYTVVLSEWRHGPHGIQIESWAQTRGMHHASLTDGRTANGLFVASRTPFQTESSTPSCKGAGALMQAHFDGLSLLACYFPSLVVKEPFFARCAEIAAENADKPFLMLGDLNTGNQSTDREARGVRYTCAAAFDELSTQHGLHDLWRHSNGSEARQWTWLSHRQNGFRIDHAFGNAAFLRWANPSCRYDHTCRGPITDHSAIIVECSGNTPPVAGGSGLDPHPSSGTI
jgi:exonuclease III